MIEAKFGVMALIQGLVSSSEKCGGFLKKIGGNPITFKVSFIAGFLYAFPS